MEKRWQKGRNRVIIILCRILAARIAGIEVILPDAAVNNFLVTSGLFIYYGTAIYVWILIIRVLLTWINPNPYSPAMRFLSRLTDPLLNRADRWFPLAIGGLNFAPFAAIIVVHLVGQVLGLWLVCLGQGQPFLMLAPLAALGLISLFNAVAWFLVIVMAIRFVMSLVQPSPYNLLVQIVFGMTEPMLAPLRGLFPPGPRGRDWRPLVFLLAALVVQWVVLASLGKAARLWMISIASGTV